MPSGAVDKREDRMRDDLLVTECHACRIRVIETRSSAVSMESTRVQRQGGAGKAVREGMVTSMCFLTSPVGRISVFLCGSGRR
jgi:hypothetical protein